MPSSIYGFYFSDHKFASHTVPKYGHLSNETQDIYTDNMERPHVMYKHKSHPLLQATYEIKN